MREAELQSLVEQISLSAFGKPFRHQARFNGRLRSTGGRYLLTSHDIEINPLHFTEHGPEELIGIIKHELCHYHLHLEGRGYRHTDPEFKQLLQQVGGTRYCKEVSRGRRRLAYKYLLTCRACGMEYKRKRKIDLRKYRCGRCGGRLKLAELCKM